MSDSAITKDCLVHYDSRHIQLRRDYFGLCVYDKDKFNKQTTKNGKRVKDEPNQECMAMILRLLETLTDDKRKEWFMKANDAKQKGLQPPSEPKETFIALTYGSICHLLYDTHCESTVRNSVAELLARKFIKRRQKTNNSIPEYALNIEVLQAALNKQAEDVLNGVSKSTAITKVRRKKSGVEIDSQLDAFDSQATAFDSQATAFNTNNKYSNKGDNKPSEKEENAHVSDDNAPTPTLSESNSPSSLQSIPPEEKAPAPSDEQSSKQAASHSQSTPNTTQDSAKQAPTEQPTLIARPEKPEMPPTSMRWSAEKLVQIVEAYLGAYYDELQRPDQIKAAQKILKRGVKEEPFVQGYCKRNDAWWHEKKGKLHVTHMAANTQRGQMRILEVLSEMGTSPTKEIKQATNTAAAIAEAQARDEKNRASLEKMRQRKAALEAKKQGA